MNLSLGERRRIGPFVLDGMLALALLSSAIYIAYQADTLVPPHVIALILIFTPIAWRRRHPLLVTWVIGIALLGNLLLGFSNTFFENFAILVAAYSLIANGPLGASLYVTGLVGVIGIHVGIALGWRNAGHVNLADIPYNWLLFAMPAVLGYGVRTRRAYVEQLEERNRLLAKQATAEERDRIARELHDVVAHSVSVMVLQATAGARLARRDPVEAASSFEVIEEAGRQSLAELRRVVGLLRDGEKTAELLPQPGLDELQPLLKQIRRAGLEVELVVTGERRVLPAGVELSAYRIIQESLTNVLKHSGSAYAEVYLSYGAQELVLEIRDHGAGKRAPAAGPGHGLTGMRERVSLFGGDLEAGALADGYRVRARLPLEATPM